MEKTNWGSVKHFLNIHVKGQVHHMSKYGQNYSFGSITPLYVPGGKLCQLKRLTVTVLSISENLKVKREGHQMTKYEQKCSFGAITLI